MSAAPGRNWASMLKEKKSVAPKPVVVAPTQEPAKPVEPTPAAAAAAPVPELAPIAPPVSAAEPPQDVTSPTQPLMESVMSTVSVSTPVTATAPAPAVVRMGPVQVPESLSKLVMPDEFRFAGSVAHRQPAAAAPQPAAANPPAPATPQAPVAVAPTVTSSSEIRGHPQWTAPQPVYNPPVNYFVPQQSGPRPYGGELGSVPRYYNAERHFTVEQQHHAQPYHPTYQTPYYSRGYYGGYGGAAYNPYDNVYPSYYHGQGAPYMGGRLQAQQPYYPPRNYQQQQQ